MSTQSQAKASIEQLVERYRGVSDRAGVTEANVVRQFVDPLLRTLKEWGSLWP